MKLQIITGAKIQKGLVIEFKTATTINTETIIEIEYEGKRQPFKIKEVEVSGDLLIGRAQECGYWANNLANKKELDIRTLIGIDVEILVDSERIKEINNSSLYC